MDLRIDPETRQSLARLASAVERTTLSKHCSTCRHWHRHEKNVITGGQGWGECRVNESKTTPLWKPDGPTRDIFGCVEWLA